MTTRSTVCHPPPPLPQGDHHGLTTVVNRCGEVGHFARVCRAAAPMPRSWPRSGNVDKAASPTTPARGGRPRQPPGSPRDQPPGSPQHQPPGSPRHQPPGSPRHQPPGSPRHQPPGSPRHQPPGSRGCATMLPVPSPSTETYQAVQEMWRRSCEGLEDYQCQELKKFLDGNIDLYAANDKDCTRTRLVQHSINTGSSPPIHLRPHRLALAKRQVAEEKIREMAAAGVIEPSDSRPAGSMSHGEAGRQVSGLSSWVCAAGGSLEEVLLPVLLGPDQSLSEADSSTTTHRDEDRGPFYKTHLILESPCVSCEVKLLSLGGRSSVAVSGILVGLRPQSPSPGPGCSLSQGGGLGPGPTIDMQRVQTLVEEMGSSLSPGAQSLMDMVKVQQKNQVSGLGGLLPLLMGSPAFSASLPQGGAGPLAPVQDGALPLPSLVIFYCPREVQLPLPRTESLEGTLRIEGHGGDELGSAPHFLPMLQSVCGQVTQLRLEGAALEKNATATWELDEVMERRLEDIERRLKEHVDRRLDALELKLEQLLLAALPPAEGLGPGALPPAEGLGPGARLVEAGVGTEDHMASLEPLPTA
ncbi:hypothetical protein NHX12_024742 [Muraenolepis orangiensis]|uniref:CCHC-type domain-containing protein n=1 Tax=Muraenolepis orangiensis TaxID=630683 RepID=A0A9Q0ISL1_9TELE|nr:hypothetical protein NHX12_024742 [Muraenolepis orangiensis]